MIRVRLLVRFAFAFGVTACGSASNVIDAGAPDMTISIPCVTAADCPTKYPLCLYAIADGCSAKGYCGLPPQQSTTTIYLCGCDGQPVPTDEWYYAGGGGFAYAPVSSADPSVPCGKDGG